MSVVIEKVNCDKCNKEIFQDKSVWCNTCGVGYCQECAVIGLPKNFELPVYPIEQDYEGWDGDRGFVVDECANCYLKWCDPSEFSDEKYTEEDIPELSKNKY